MNNKKKNPYELMKQINYLAKTNKLLKEAILIQRGTIKVCETNRITLEDTIKVAKEYIDMCNKNVCDMERLNKEEIQTNKRISEEKYNYFKDSVIAYNNRGFIYRMFHKASV